MCNSSVKLLRSGSRSSRWQFWSQFDSSLSLLYHDRLYYQPKALFSQRGLLIHLWQRKFSVGWSQRGEYQSSSVSQSRTHYSQRSKVDRKSALRTAWVGSLLSTLRPGNLSAENKLKVTEWRSKRLSPELSSSGFPCMSMLPYKTHLRHHQGLAVSLLKLLC